MGVCSTASPPPDRLAPPGHSVLTSAVPILSPPAATTILRGASGSFRHLLVALGLVAGCADPPPIVIGISGPFADPAGATMVQAAQMAIDEINQAGGLRGRHLELAAYDDHGNPDSAVAVAGIIRATAAVAVIGHVWSSTTLAAAPIYGGGQNPVAVVTPSSSAPELTALGPHLFRACPTDLEHGRALADWAWTGLGLQRAAVLYFNDGYGRGIKGAFATTFERRGGSIVGAYPFLDPAGDVAPYLDLLARDGLAQALIVAGSRDEARSILEQARARGITLPVLGGDGLEGLEDDGAVGEGVFISNAWLPAGDQPRIQEFLSNWRLRYPDLPLPNQPAAASYDIVHLLAATIREVGTDRQRLRAALAAVGKTSAAHEGVTGTIQFTDQGDLAGRSVGIAVIRSGRLERVDTR